MQIGMIGLGRMGAGMTQRLMSAGHEFHAFDVNAAQVDLLRSLGATGASSIEDLIQRMSKPRVVWVMVPAGNATDKIIEDLASLMSAGDIIIDGGNSFYQDDIRHADALKPKGIHFIDVGTSGGVWGMERGYCLMIGGDKEPIQACEPIFKALAPGKGSVEQTPGREGKVGTSEDGFLHCGPTGAGHYVKMIHNGIEYGMMQAYAEGFDILKGASKAHIPAERRYDFNIADIAEVWRRGSVVGSWLLDLSAIALNKDPALSQFSGQVDDSGEGRWTVNAAVEQGVAAEVLTTSLFKRFRSREKATFAEKIVSAMRFQFGGHVEKK